MRIAISLIVSLVISGNVLAQPKVAPKKVENPNGYQKITLEGFTVYFSNQCLEEEKKSKLTVLPKKCVELELQLMRKVIPADKFKLLQQVPIFVDWNTKVKRHNGRDGYANAFFMAGLIPLPTEPGKNPLQPNAVGIVDLQSLAGIHQVKQHNADFTMLHEMAHAYHHYVLGLNNGSVNDTFRVAMERKIYSKDQYLTTNPIEYFAELSCAYFSPSYLFSDRAEFKERDPKGYELMEKSWGKLPLVADPKAKRSLLPSSDREVTLDVTINPRALSRTISGSFGQNGPTEALKAPMLLTLHDRLGPDLRVILRVARREMEYRTAGGSVVAAMMEGTGSSDLSKYMFQYANDTPLIDGQDLFNPKVGDIKEHPHAMVFDHLGKCVYRGNLGDAFVHMNAAMGQYLLDRASASKETPAAKSLRKLMDTGTPMPMLISKVQEVANSGNTGSNEIKLIAESLNKGAQERLQSILGYASNGPMIGFVEAEKLLALYKGYPVAKAINAYIADLKKKPDVAQEVKARALYVSIEKIDAQLSAMPMSFRPERPEFRKQHEKLLKQLDDLTARLIKQYPESLTGRQCTSIRQEWLLDKK